MSPGSTNLSTILPISLPTKYKLFFSPFKALSSLSSPPVPYCPSFTTKMGPLAPFWSVKLAFLNFLLHFPTGAFSVWDLVDHWLLFSLPLEEQDRNVRAGSLRHDEVLWKGPELHLYRTFWKKVLIARVRVRWFKVIKSFCMCPDPKNDSKTMKASGQSGAGA